MNTKNIATLKKIGVFSVLFFISCTEAPLITPKGQYRLNSPTSMVEIPGTNLAVVANANTNLNQISGALMAVDLNSNTLLLNTLFTIPNFAGDMFLDTKRSRLYIPDHSKSLLVYNYQVPGAHGEPISFSEVKIPVPVSPDLDVNGGIETDLGPTQALMISGTSLGDLILVSNQKGTISMIPANTLIFKNMSPFDDYYGLPLVSAVNFNSESSFPGRGASRMVVDSRTGLIYITSTLNNQIYILEPDTQTIQAMIDLDPIASPTIGMRDMVIDANGTAYIAHSGLDSIIVLDVSGITKNGISMEVVNPPLIDIIPVGAGPEDVQLLNSGQTLFVSNQNDDSIFMVDTTLRQVINKVYLDRGKNPGRLILDESRNTLYCLDSFSDSITRINATTGNFVGDIK